MLAGLTVLVVDKDARIRAQLVEALRTLGLHAIGAYVAQDAVALLDGIEADLVLVRCSDDADIALSYLRRRSMLVHVPEDCTVEDTVGALVRALGGSADAHAN
jgi:DNA-binding NtrC family response regulator